VTQRTRTTEQPRLWAVSPLLILLLASVGTSGCLLKTPKGCTTTYTCCLENHPHAPHVCNGLEGAEVATFQLTSPTSQGASVGQMAVAAAAGFTAGSAIGVLIQGDDDDLDELQDRLDEIVEECAERAEQTVNRRRLGKRVLTAAQCNEQVGTDEDGKPVTQAMALGNEKHTEAFECLKGELGKFIPGYFLIEQRYRFDPRTGRIEPISKEEEERLKAAGRKKELKGTLQPDVFIHSGDPTRARFVYDFKFPCVKGTPPTWRIYTRGPYQDSTQGQMYRKAFDVQPGRVEPGKKGVIR
jgi:hypothetical protein